MAQIIPIICIAARASALDLPVLFFVFCKGMCAAQRSKWTMKNKSVELVALISRILSHRATNAVLCNVVIFVLENVTVRLRRDH